MRSWIDEMRERLLEEAIASGKSMFHRREPPQEKIKTATPEQINALREAYEAGNVTFKPGVSEQLYRAAARVMKENHTEDKLEMVGDLTKD